MGERMLSFDLLCEEVGFGEEAASMIKVAVYGQDEQSVKRMQASRRLRPNSCKPFGPDAS